jgi:hypothetical protein
MSHKSNEDASTLPLRLSKGKSCLNYVHKNSNTLGGGNQRRGHWMATIYFRGLCSCCWGIVPTWDSNGSYQGRLLDMF